MMMDKKLQKKLVSICKEFIDLPVTEQVKFMKEFKKLPEDEFINKERKIQLEGLFLDLMARKNFGHSLEEISIMVAQ